ncbi:chaperonin 10-like protein [Rhodotorula diobovata]|uniref:Chaperonin 10-like protein n=1 Tax=Rhodotorula diobovata TaxID=5288 RepID=A0A5C5G442_9BASI|nr:chaperonin 10-like protein [Rhodotorula diobovata]
MAPSTILAMRYHGEPKLSLEAVPVPALRPGEVQVKVAFCGICGSDLHEVYHGPLTCTCPGHPHPLTDETLPAVLGHEFSGEVVALGEGVESEGRLKVGSRVCIEPVISCRDCDACREGDTPLCDKQIGLYGYSRAGGLAPYVNVAMTNVHVVPDNVPLDVAALAEPLSVAWHAVAVSGFQAGETAFVLGCGPIGALVTRVLVARGASAVYVSEPSPVRRAIAAKCGATAAFDPLEDDAVGLVREATGGRGVDIAIDCAGTQRTLDGAVESTRRKGRIVMVALWDKAVKPQVEMWALMGKERILTGSSCFNARDMRQVLAALSSGQIVVDDLITQRIALSETFDKGLEVLRQDPAQVKILVDLSKEAAE